MSAPNLSRLVHRPLPTGVDRPRTRARSRAAKDAAQDAVLSNNDLLAKILAALNAESGPDDACAIASTYCAAGACAEDVWSALLALVFPESAGTSATPKAKFVALCRRWDRGRKLRYERDLDMHQRALSLVNSVPNLWELLDFLAATIPKKIFEPLLQKGVVHVSNVFVVPPMHAYGSLHPEPFASDNWGNQKDADDAPSDIRLGHPRTLLGLLLAKMAGVALVKTLLGNFGADPNAKFASVEHLQFEEHVIPPEDLNHDDEGAAECLALRHVYAIIGRKLKRQFNKASNFDDVDPFEATTATDLQSLGWFDVPGESVRQGERSTMLGYYRLLYNYGGDVYNAAMMYRAYGERFDEFGLRDMADHIEEFARFVTTAEGAVPITKALRAELLAKHRARLRRRDPYHNAPTYPAEE